MGVCSSCAAENREGARFCDSCGAALAEAPTAREERKVVTVLFADLVGFTGRAEQLDPEDVRALLTPYHARLRTELERHGGTVEKFIGDAVMALFGAPVAHEDDPERAVRAALAIRDAIGELNEADPDLGLQVRVGVMTGEALVALGARPAEGEGMAAGDVVNTAARLQSAAPVDGILVGEATYRATRDVIVYREAEPVEAKGKAEPVPVWEAVEARASLGVDVGQGGGPELVGRRDEVDLLRDALARSRRDRAVQLVTIVGVPGIGKSRLVYELFEAVDADAEIVYWRQGRCLPYGDGVTFWAVGEMVKAHAGVLENDDAEAVTAKLGAAVRGVASDSGEAEWLETHLRPLVGAAAEDAGRASRAESFAAWQRFFEAVAEQRPLVLVFDDLHWADEGVLDFVNHLVDRASEVSLLVVCSTRPELLERRPDWGGGKRNALTISLAPLSEEETARLLAVLLEQAVLPAEVQAALLAHAGGNPLYAEEYIRMLLDRGYLRRDNGTLRLERAEELPLPETVQGILAARLDALPLDEKSRLQDAAVVGKVFWVGALQSIGGGERWEIEEQLHQLERKDFVRRQRRSSVANEREFVFRHVLVRDAAYGQLPRGSRSERHRLAAEWIEALASDRADDRAEMLAHHYTAALEYAAASGGAPDLVAARAREALRDAAERAAALGAPAAAVRHLRTALELWPADDPARPRVVLQLGAALYNAEMGGDDDLAQAARNLLELGDPEGAAAAEVILSQLAWGRGDQAGSFAHLERAHELVADRPPSDEKASAFATLASKTMTAGRFDETIRYAREALALYEELGDPAGRAEILNTLGVARASSGDPGGFDNLAQSVAIARELNLPSVLGRGCLNLASTLEQFGELQRVPDLIDEATGAWDRSGNQMMIRWLRVERATVGYMRGRWDESIEVLDAFVEESQQSPHYMEQAARHIRSLIRMARGETELALADASRAVELARAAGDPQAVYPSLGAAARCFLDAGRPEEGAAFAGEALAMFRDGAHTMTPSVWTIWTALVLGGRADFVDAMQHAAVDTRWLDAARLVAAGEYSAASDKLGDMGALAEEAYCRLRAAETGEAGAEDELRRTLRFFEAVRASAYTRRCETLLAA